MRQRHYTYGTTLHSTPRQGIHVNCEEHQTVWIAEIGRENKRGEVSVCETALRDERLSWVSHIDLAAR
jgi:hypothetical protein